MKCPFCEIGELIYCNEYEGSSFDDLEECEIVQQYGCDNEDCQAIALIGK